MMKKSLIALAVLGASGFAMAQSSVTLYGVADGGIGKPAGVKGARFTGGTQNVNNGASRVGFTGVEDLGNGLKAGFQFETGLRLDDGMPASGGINMERDNNFWGRQANVFIGGGWGTIKMGRQLAASYIASGAYDLTGQANYSVIDNSFDGNHGFPNRANSAIAYVTPNFSGFQGAVAMVHKNNLGGSPAKTIWDLGVWYKSGGLSAGFGANKNTSGTKTNYHLGAKYAFGNFTVGAGFHNGHYVGNAKRRGFNLGVQAKFGAFTVTADAVRVTKNGGGKKFTNAVLEAKYALSKRTFVYADVLRRGDFTDHKTGYGLGIRHNF